MQGSGPLKGAVSAQKALQGSETGELLEGRKNNIILTYEGVIVLLFRQINGIFKNFTKKANAKKLCD